MTIGRAGGGSVYNAGRRPGGDPAASCPPAYGTPRRVAGFTYIGLLFLVAMMGLALTQAAAMWQTVQQREKEKELLFVGDQFRRAFARYYAAGGGYPRQLDDLVKDPRFPGMRRFLRKIYRDPITGSSEWGLVKQPGGLIGGVYSLSEAEPIKKAEFGLADQSFEGKMKYSEWVFMPKYGPATGANPNAPATSPAGTNQPGVTQPQPGMMPPQFGTPRR